MELYNKGYENSLSTNKQSIETVGSENYLRRSVKLKYIRKIKFSAT